jgi:hypothetical protein
LKSYQVDKADPILGFVIASLWPVLHCPLAIAPSSFHVSTSGVFAQQEIGITSNLAFSDNLAVIGDLDCFLQWDQPRMMNTSESSPPVGAYPPAKENLL